MSIYLINTEEGEAYSLDAGRIRRHLFIERESATRGYGPVFTMEEPLVNEYTDAPSSATVEGACLLRDALVRRY